jgi:transposase-like protein
MDCPKCKSSHHVKDGVVHGRQRHRCKECHYHYTVERKSDVKTLETKRLALVMYLEGLGFRSIGRILKISYGTAYIWIKKWSEQISFPRSECPAEKVELEKMLAYIETKASSVQYGLLLIDLETNKSMLSMKSITG